MPRSLRVVAVVIFASIILSTMAHASALVGPELDPGWMAAGLTMLAGGGMYLVERFRRR